MKTTKTTIELIGELFTKRFIEGHKNKSIKKFNIGAEQCREEYHVFLIIKMFAWFIGLVTLCVIPIAVWHYKSSVLEITAFAVLGLITHFGIAKIASWFKPGTTRIEVYQSWKTVRRILIRFGILKKVSCMKVQGTVKGALIYEETLRLMIAAAFQQTLEHLASRANHHDTEQEPQKKERIMNQIREIADASKAFGCRVDYSKYFIVPTASRGKEVCRVTLTAAQ